MKNTNQSRGTGAQTVSNPLGIIALGGVEIADRTYTEARNDFASFLRTALIGAADLPISNPIFPLQSGATYVAVYGAGAINDADLLANIQFELPVAAAAQVPDDISVMGYLITERYQNFTGGRAHGLEIRGYHTNYTEAVDFRRYLTVAPTDPVNGTAEYVILNMVPSFTPAPPANAAISGQSVQSIASLTRDPKGYLMPWRVRNRSTNAASSGFSPILVNLKGVSADATINGTVMPLLRTIDCIKSLAGILNVPFERLNS